MRITEAAKIVGISAVTLRRMEAAGLIRPKRDRNGWRRFDQSTIRKAMEYIYPQRGKRRRGL